MLSTSVCVKVCVCVCITLYVHENFHEPWPCCRSIGRSRALHLCSIHTHTEPGQQKEKERERTRENVAGVHLPTPYPAHSHQRGQLMPNQTKPNHTRVTIVVVSSFSQKASTYSQPPIRVGLFGWFVGGPHSNSIRDPTKMRFAFPLPAVRRKLRRQCPLTKPLHCVPQPLAVTLPPFHLAFQTNWLLCSCFRTACAAFWQPTC